MSFRRSRPMRCVRGGLMLDLPHKFTCFVTISRMSSVCNSQDKGRTVALMPNRRRRSSQLRTQTDCAFLRRALRSRQIAVKASRIFFFLTTFPIFTNHEKIIFDVTLSHIS